MENYKIVTAISENGPHIIKFILEIPFDVHCSDVTVSSFNIYAERREDGADKVLEVDNPFTGVHMIYQGYLAAKAVYICDENGRNCTAQGSSRYVAIEPEESPLNNRVEGDVLRARCTENRHRITLLHTIGGDPTKSGLIWENCVDEIILQLDGWKSVIDGNEVVSASLYNNRYKARISEVTPDGKILGDVSEDMTLSYGYFDPQPDEKVPLVIWLHGAGEGGWDIRIPHSANMLCNLGTADYQKYFGGKAYIMVPQCPTVYMDDGNEQLGRSNKSLYVKPLKNCIDSFIANHKDTVDMDRIYIGGMSNGGFMTMRMILDYPDFFAAAVPCCEVFYSANITEDMLSSIKNIPIWFVHSRWDELVPPFETAVPTYQRLKAAGATNVHFTFYDQLFMDENKYRDEFGRKIKGFNHAVWNLVLDNACRTDFDGTYVMDGGAPVTIWEWVGRQRKQDKQTV